MNTESLSVVAKLVQYSYTGEYTTPLPEDQDFLDTTALQLQARIIALSDKYDVKGPGHLAAEKYHSKLDNDFNLVEFLESIPDVYESTPHEFERRGIQRSIMHERDSRDL